MDKSPNKTPRVSQDGDGPAWIGSASGPKKVVFPWKLTIAFALVILCVLAGGYWFYTSQERLRKEGAETDLKTVAQLKVRQIADWREGRLAAASVLMESPFLNETIARWMAAPEPVTTEELRALFRSRQKHGQYFDVLLVDANAQVRISLRDNIGPLHEDAAQGLAAAFRERRSVLTDLHVGPRDLPPHIDIIAPFFAAGGKVSEPVGAIVLQTDARHYLYPLIQSWPTISRSAETLIVRRDGDSVLYLNELRYQKDTALKLRLPLSRQDLPAVRAVLGREGLFTGKDYRGIKVLAILKAIPDSPWFMVAKVDTADVFSAWHFQAGLILSVLILLLISISVGAAIAWQIKQKTQYRALYEAEAALRLSEIRYHTTLMSVGDGVIASDVQGRVQLMNPMAETLTGWKLEEASGRPLEEVFHIVNEETRREMENPVRRVVRDGLVVGLANHAVLISRSGRECAIADSGAPVRSETGEITGVVLVFRDQTEQRAAVKALRENEERFRHVSSAISDIAYSCVASPDGDYSIDWMAGASERITGYTAEEIKERGCWHFLVVEEDLALFKKHVTDLAPGSSGSCELRIRHKNGHIEWVTSYTDCVLEAEEPRRTRLYGGLVDVTERKLDEEALRDSEERFKIIFEFAPDAYLLSDLKGNFTDVNLAAERITGYKREELIGASYLTLNLLSADQYFKSADVLALNARGEETGPDEFILHRRDGSQIAVDIATYPVKIKGVTAVLGIARDISQRKNDEEQLKATLNDRDVMLREIHHRVKNNMQIISSLLRLQSQSITDKKTLEIFNESQSRIRSMALIHEKLYQSRDYSRVEFADYVRKTITHLFSLYEIPAGSISYKVEAEDIYLDIGRAIPCGLIINELVTNSLKHAFPGKRKGEIIVRISKQDDAKYRLMVKDTGVGLPEDFDPDKQKTLGFQIIRDLVRQLEGSMKVKKDSGTEIIVLF
jgi:two-component system cell cycle sensor histidine kinase/response regulator CckA